MVFKNIIIAVIAFQVVNAGVIIQKPYSLELQDILDKFMNIAVASEKRLEEIQTTLTESRGTLNELSEKNGKEFGYNFEIMKTIQQAVHGDWVLDTCFVPEENNIGSLVYEYLRNVGICASITTNESGPLSDTGRKFYKDAKDSTSRLDEEWNNCEEDASCQEKVLTNGNFLANQFGNSFRRFEGEVETFKDVGIKDMFKCGDYVLKESKSESSRIAVNIIYCINSNKPNTQ